MESHDKPLFWIGSTRRDLREFPEEARRACGYALRLAQKGHKHPGAKPLKGFAGAGVLEVVDDHAGDTYHAVYTVRFAGAVYALHAFQKKAKHGIRSPKHEIDLIRERLRRAEEHYREWKEEYHGQS